MVGSAAPVRFDTIVPGRALGALTALVLVLAAALVLAPPPLADTGNRGFADQDTLRQALRDGFVAYWNSGGSTRPPALTSVIDYWFRFHVVKGVIAVLLLVTLVALAALLWKAYLRAGGLGAGQQSALATAGAVVSMFAFGALLVAIANIQGAVAPFSSLLPMLPSGANDPQLTTACDQIRQQLTESTGATPTVDDMVRDFARYHITMAVIAAILAITAVGLSAVSWSRFVRSADTRSRRLLCASGIVTALLSPASLVLLAANTSAAMNSTTALSAFFDGSW
ncbi:hypothetical protein ACFRAQ_08390 [Nocardia sp. NPDC056611]|uniref:hypothetical protein n=1 Tax=Nocardia sp. NPDC056611 TaxID=3345877 RepID=UPI00366CD430